MSALSRLRAAAALALAALLSGCGWHAGLVAPGGADTVGVEHFDLQLDVLERDLEPELQDALSRALIDLVDLRIADPRRSDLVVRGRIRDYRRRSGIRSPDHDLLETAVRITVEAELVRRSSGAILRRAQGSLPIGYVTADRIDDPVTGEADYVVPPPGAERDARDRALRILAEGLVLDLFRTAPLDRS